MPVKSVDLPFLVHQSDSLRFHVEEFPFVLSGPALLSILETAAFPSEHKLEKPTDDQRQSLSIIVPEDRLLHAHHLRCLTHIAIDTRRHGSGIDHVIVSVASHIRTVADVRFE